MKDYEGLLPAFFPPNNLNADVKKLNEQMNRYNIPSNVMSLANVRRTRFTFPAVSNSVKYKSKICRMSLLNLPWKR